MNNLFIKNLSVKHLDPIYKLIKYNYYDDISGIYSKHFSKRFLLWYIRKIRDGRIIGIMKKKSLIGCIMCAELIIDKKSYNYINFLCIKKKYNELDLENVLISEIIKRIKDEDYIIYLNSDQYSFDDIKCRRISESIVPFNQKKLKKIGYIDKIDKLKTVNNNPLQTLNIDDIDSLIEYIETNSKIQINYSHIINYILPNKGIVHTYVKYTDKKISDFCSLYIYDQYVHETNTYIHVAYLNICICLTLSTEKVILLCLDKLKKYGIDQLILEHTENLDITHYTSLETRYYYSNCDNIFDSSNLFIFPF